MDQELARHALAIRYRRRRLAQVIEDLDMQIARLALTMGLHLDGDAERVLAQEADRLAGAAQSRHLLVGLVTLRYGIVRRCAEEVGAPETLRMLEEIEDHLLVSGFRPGADGVNLDRLTGSE